MDFQKSAAVQKSRNERMSVSFVTTSYLSRIVPVRCCRGLGMHVHDRCCRSLTRRAQAFTMALRDGKDDKPSIPPPPDSSPTRQMWIRGLRYPLPLLPSGRGARAGYILSCVAAGLAGAPVLGICGALFLAIGAVSESPTVLVMIVACFVAALTDLSGNLFGNLDGRQLLMREAPGFLLFLSIVFATSSVDDDVEPAVPRGIDNAVNRVEQVKQAERDRAQREQRDQIRRQLGIEERSRESTVSDLEDQSRLKAWDADLDREK